MAFHHVTFSFNFISSIKRSYLYCIIKCKKPDVMWTLSKIPSLPTQKKSGFWAEGSHWYKARHFVTCSEAKCHLLNCKKDEAQMTLVFYKVILPFVWINILIDDNHEPLLKKRVMLLSNLFWKIMFDSMILFSVWLSYKKEIKPVFRL